MLAFGVVSVVSNQILLCFSLCSLLVFFHANDDDDESEPAVQGSISARSLARSLALFLVERSAVVSCK
jgi:hypothetical protein